MSNTGQRPIIVVGAGVIGLSTALTLQRRHPRTSIMIVAAEFPTLPSSWTSSDRPSADYASVWAGAHYRPIPRTTRQLNYEADIAVQTAKIMFTIANRNTEAGVEKMSAVEYLEQPVSGYSDLKTGIVYAGSDDKFRILNEEELPNGVSWGCEYEAYCVNVHVYLSWLLRRFIDGGGKVVEQRLGSIEDAFRYTDGQSNTIPVVVNCSGRNFDSDPKMQIIRGQTVLVRNEYHRTVTRQNKDGSWSFLIPRPGGGGTVVGGTKEIGDTETQARSDSRARLLTQAVRHFPDFVDDVSKFKIVMDNVGRRPWREGGVRVDIEALSDDRNIVHGYGAGGRGYELSWGMAEQIADLVDQTLRPHSRL